MNVDRDQQQQILQILFDAWPWDSEQACRAIKNMIKEDEPRAIGNLMYLQSHNLIEPYVEIICAGNSKTSDGFGGFVKVYRADGYPRLTAKGIDFLLGDEGLSSILNTRRVVISEDSLRFVISEYISQLKLNETTKNELVAALKKAPGKVLQDMLSQAMAGNFPLAKLLSLLTNNS